MNNEVKLDVCNDDHISREGMPEHGKYCPIMVAGANTLVSQCIGKDCAWWIPYANDCALPVVAGILADSTICQNVFETESDENG